MIEKLRATYKEYNIKANQVPEGQTNFGVQFGWAFSVEPLTSNKALFIVVIKSLTGKPTQTNLDQSFKLGEKIVHSLIDTGEFRKDYYCYQWEPNEMNAVEVDCDKISPNGLRTPLQ
ncbi:MAG: hypothetical protein KDJ52_27225 [Anaerolineae bacterium]|nr:hypothetical protein [Anaerolineae bacterium]